MTGSVPTPAPARPARRRLAAGALASVVAQGTQLAAGAVLSIATARLLGASGTGRYGVAVALFVILAPSALLGLRAGVVYFVSRDEWPVRRALEESQAAAVGLGLLVAVVVVPLYVLWPDGPLKGLGGDVLALTLVAVAFWVAWTLSSSILLARERYERFAGVQVVQAVAMIVASVGLMIPFGVVGAVGGLAAAQVVAAAVAAGYVLAEPGARSGRRARLRLTELRRGIAFGMPPWLGELLWLVSFRIDVVVLNAYVASSTVGVYFVAGSLGALAWILPSALQTVLFPRVAALGAEGLDESDRTVARSMRHAVLLMPATALGLALVLAVGVPLLYGPEFDEAVTLGFLLLPGVLVAGVGKVVAGALTGLGRPVLTLLPTLVSAPPTIAAYLVVIPEAGAAGAAIVSSVSYALGTALGVTLLVRVTRIPPRTLLVPGRAELGDLRSFLTRN